MKKLYKTEQGKKICGVCGGIAEYFNLDPSIVRIIWAAVTIFYGTGLVLYIIAAFILPSKSEVYYETVKDDKENTDGPLDGEVIDNDK